MEILSSIDHAFHSIMADTSHSIPNGYRECKALADELKFRLPEYIDKQCDLIGRKPVYINFLKQIKADNPKADIQIPD